MTGILARSIPSDEADLKAQSISPISIVVCNLYPFTDTIARPDCTLANAVEECKELRAKSSSTPKDEDAIFSMKADFVVVDDMLALRTKIQEGTSYSVSIEVPHG